MSIDKMYLILSSPSSNILIMITRVVKMHFKEESLDAFMEMFVKVKEKIRNQPGCIDLEMLQNANDKGIIFTYSHWESEEDLNNYRHTPLFGEVWRETKSYFAAKAEAWTLTSLYKLD